MIDAKAVQLQTFERATAVPLPQNPIIDAGVLAVYVRASEHDHSRISFLGRLNATTGNELVQ